MGWNFRKSIKIFPGLRVNFGKRGFTSVSVGPKGLKINTGKKGTFLGVSIPGTGVYFRERIGEPSSSPRQPGENGSFGSILAGLFVSLLGGSLLLVLVFLAFRSFSILRHHHRHPLLLGRSRYSLLRDRQMIPSTICPSSQR